MSKEQLNTREVAERLGLHPSTLKNWRTKDEGPPFIKLGEKVVYEEEALLAWVAKRVVVPSRKAAAPQYRRRVAEAA